MIKWIRPLFSLPADVGSQYYLALNIFFNFNMTSRYTITTKKLDLRSGYSQKLLYWWMNVELGVAYRAKSFSPDMDRTHESPTSLVASCCHTV